MIVACLSYPCIAVNSSRLVTAQRYRFSLIALKDRGAIDGPQPLRGSIGRVGRVGRVGHSAQNNRLTQYVDTRKGATPPRALIHGVPPTSRTSRTFCPKTRSSDGNIGIRKDARSIGIGRGTKCRRPMYKRTYYVSTLYGSPGRGGLLGDPQGVEVVGEGGTSVTASRMTDAYGASTLRVPHG